MNFKKKVNGSWVDIPHYVHKTDTDTITTLPADIYPNAVTATVGLKGNTVQSTTPTPQNPVMPNGTGERTGNLFDKSTAVIGERIYTDRVASDAGWAHSDFIDITGIDFITVSRRAGITTFYFYADKTNQSISYYQGDTAEVPNDAKYVRINMYVSDVNSNMLVVGSIAPTSYIPYGYKLEIDSGGTTTPVYLGGVETTKKVKKLVLTGKETSYMVIDASKNIFSIRGVFNQAPGLLQVGSFCTHYKYNNVISSLAQNMSNGDFVLNKIVNDYSFTIRDNSFSNDTDFKQYVQQQYAAGTPVTVWYVLATEETAVVNEPLMKISTYADTVSNVSIPVTAGGDTLSVDTTVQPSEVSVNYHGWHPVADVHVYPDSSWMPTSWEEFRKAVRSGEAQSLYPIGTKLYENWGDDTSNAWIVVDYPSDNRYIDTDLAQQGYTNRVMLMEEKINYLRIFDNQEAWLYAETAIPAGTYRFTIPNYDTAYGGNKTYIFTSTADVPVGGQLTLTWSYQQNPSAVQAYSSSTATSALFNVSIAEWDGATPCTDLGTIKLAMSDADNTYGKLNHIHRVRYGSNNYAQSGIRQWLNSDASANAWWQPTTIFDRPYSNRNMAGRLNTMNSDMKSVIATPTINCITNNLFESPSLDGTTFALQTAYTVKDKLFPVTHTEVNLSSTPNVDSILSYYTGAGNADRIKYRADNGDAYYWWLRTPYPTYAHGERNVNTSGALGGNSASNTNGGVVACIIQ